MILPIPSLYVENGKSKYSISGLPEFKKIESYFKNNPIELAKLFREENNKSLLIHIDVSNETFDFVNKINEILDIPIQILTESENIDELIRSSQLSTSRIFIPIKNSNIIPSSIPIIKISELKEHSLDPFKRVMIDFEQKNLKNINLGSETKISIINSKCNTLDLIEINQIDTNIDSVYLGKEYYGVHFAGQLLWRIAEKAQFAI